MSGNSPNTTRLIPAGLEQHAREIAVRPVSYEVVDVSINLNDGLLSFLEEYYNAIVQRLNQQGATVVPITPEELRRYVVTLIYSRVRYVRNEPGVPVHYSQRVMVPSFISFVLSGLGRVEIPELGVELVPAYTPPREDLMTLDEAVGFSNRLRPMSSLGFEFASGYARDRVGALDLMVMQFIEGTVVSHTDKGHPAYAVAAYFLGLMQVMTLLGPRVLYGTREQMRMILRMVASE